MAKIKINKLPQGFSIRNGKVVEDNIMRDGGMTTGDQADYGLVTTPQEYYGQTSFNNSRDESVRYSLLGVPREDANIEAEGGETVLTDLNNDGTFGLYDIKGPRHGSGGVPMFLPEQSFVFSDTRKLKFTKDEMSEFDMGGSKKTPAKISKKFGLQDYYGELGSQYVDNISATSAELMLKKNMNDLSKLAFMQEAKKNFSDGVPLASHPYLVSIGEDPIEFTSKVEEISREKAERKAIQALPLEQQQQIMMLQQMMAQQEQQEEMQQGMPEQGMPQQPMMGPMDAFMPPPGEAGLAMENNAMMNSTAQFGSELGDFLIKAQAGKELESYQKKGETKTGVEVLTKENYPYPEGSDNYNKLEDYRNKGYELTIVDGRIRAYKPYESRFKDQGKVIVQDIEGLGRGETSVIPEDIAAQGEVLDTSPIGQYRPGIYSGGNRPKEQGIIYQNQVVDGVYDPSIPADESTPIYAYGSAKIKSKEGAADFNARWGDVTEQIEGFDLNKPADDPQWKEFQVLAEETRKKEAKQLGIPYIPYFKKSGDKGFVSGEGFDGAFGLHTFNTPRMDVDFTSSDEAFMDLPKEPEIFDIKEIEKAPGPIKEVWAQDQNNLIALAAIQDDLYLPWSPKLDEQKIDYVLDDYTGKVNAIMGSQNTMANALGAAGGPQAIAGSNIQGKSLNAIAQAIDTTNRTNVNIMNRASSQQAQMDAQIDMRNKAIDKGLYDDTVFALQNATNFDNEKIAKNNELFNAMMTNASNTYNLNTLYPYYNINPQAYGDVEFTENGQQLYQSNQVDQQEAFLDAYTKLRKNLPADQKIDGAFLDRYLGNTIIPSTRTTKGQEDMQQRGVPGYPGSNVQVQRGKEIKKLPKSFPFVVGKMGA